MKKENLLFLIKKRSFLVVFLAYLLFFLVLLLPVNKGIGYFWDWAWPLFRDNLAVLYNNYSNSWIDLNLGQPMLYNSSFWSNGLLAGSKYLGLQPELILYIYLSLLMTLSSFGVYLFAQKKLNIWLSFLLGLVTVLNSAYIYKLIAGHLNYLISLSIFIYLTYYLLYKYKNDLKSAIIIGLFLGFVGFQIQFFIFAVIFFIIWYLFNCRQAQPRFLLIACLLALLVNLPWLSNFIIGTNLISEISNQASNIIFSGASHTNLLRIATLSFSDATLIKYLYPKWVFAFFGLFSLGLVAMIGWKIGKKIKNSLQSTENKKCGLLSTHDQISADSCLRNNWIIFITLSIFIFLGTGVYQSWNIPILRMFYPILRESGHLAPIVILFMILLLVRLWSDKAYIKWPVTLYLVVFVLINAITIYKSVPTVDYQALRDRTKPYKEFLDQDRSVYRIANYPFFGQYSVAWEESWEVRGQPVRNTGIDIFAECSAYDSLSNYISAQMIDQSIQYKFLETHNLSLLENRNIKYLLDFSDIYQSNIEKYSDSSYYHNNLSLIKNDPELFNSLLQKYPDRIKQVAPHIYKLTQAKPRIEIVGNKTDINKVNASHYVIHIKNLSENTVLNYYSSFHPGWSIYHYGVEISANSHQELNQFGQSWYLDYNQIKKNVQAHGESINNDGSISTKIDLYFTPQKYFNISKTVAILAILVSLVALLFISCYRHLSRPA